MTTTMRGWSAENLKHIELFLKTVRPGQIAATDWDGTCIHNDIGAACFFRAVLSGLIDFSRDYVLEKIPFQNIRNHIYKLARRTSDRARLEILGTVTAAYMALLNKHGALAAFPWLACIFEGIPHKQLSAFALDVLNRELRSKIGSYSAPVAPAPLWKNTGFRHVPSYRFATGIRFYGPSLDLLNALAEKGVKIFVVSASEETSVRICVKASGLKVAGIIGQRVALCRGIMQGCHLEPVTALEGKVEALKLISGADAPPVLAAGDTTNDVQLLNKATGLRIVIDHKKPWFNAVTSAIKGSARTIVQRQFIDAPNVYMGEK